jgi:hypothetical protein
MSNGQKWLAVAILLVFVIAINLWFFTIAVPWYINSVVGLH